MTISRDEARRIATNVAKLTLMAATATSNYLIFWSLARLEKARRGKQWGKQIGIWQNSRRQRYAVRLAYLI